MAAWTGYCQILFVYFLNLSYYFLVAKEMSEHCMVGDSQETSGDITYYKCMTIYSEFALMVQLGQLKWSHLRSKWKTNLYYITFLLFYTIACAISSPTILMKMASSQRSVWYLFKGKPLRRQMKHVIMKLWDYFEWEAKKQDVD